MKKILLFAFAFLLAGSIAAHEYVLIAYNFVVKKGEELELHLFVSDGFNIEMERPFQKEITKSFELISENGTTDLTRTLKDGAFPVLKIEVDFEGLGLIHTERNYAYIELSNEDFLNYLKEDHIENIQIDDSTQTMQSERYTRYIKTLVQSNPKPEDKLYKTQLGHAFEIVLQDNPYTMEVGQWLKVQVFFEGQPLAHKTITARQRDGGDVPTFQYARTDENGFCSFKLDHEGDWFLHATHMIPSRDKSESDWESFWTTFSFGM